MSVISLPGSLLEVSLAGSIEAVYKALDGRDCFIDGAPRRVAVHGVHDDGCCKWVQLCLEGESPRLFTLRLCSSPEIGSDFISQVA